MRPHIFYHMSRHSMNTSSVRNLWVHIDASMGVMPPMLHGSSTCLAALSPLPAGSSTLLLPLIHCRIQA